MADKIKFKTRNFSKKLNSKGRTSFVRIQILKNIAMKPIPEIETYLKYGFVVTEYEKHLCPRCRSVLNAGPDYQPNYCSQCGQKVSFNGMKWKEDKELGYTERKIVNGKEKKLQTHNG